MSIYRIKHEREYFYLSNDIVNNPDISWKAKGILAYLLSKPNDWKVYTNDIVDHSKDGETAVRAGINELIEHGYIVRYQDRVQNGKFGEWAYIVYESPVCHPDIENPDVDKPDVENPNSDNHVLQSTEEQSTKKQNTKNTCSDALDIDELFELTYSEYPRHEGRAKGEVSYRNYLTTGKLIGKRRYKYNHQQIYIAVQQYADEKKDKEQQYIALFSTFMNSHIVDYVEKTKEQYQEVMRDKYGDEWEAVKFAYR